MTRAGEVAFLNRFFAEQSNPTTRPMAIFFDETATDRVTKTFPPLFG